MSRVQGEKIKTKIFDAAFMASGSLTASEHPADLEYPRPLGPSNPGLLSLYIALMHYPVYNRTGQVVSTSVANMDIHDIARTARTYGVKRYFIVTPISEQRELVGRILKHWKEGYGAEFNPSRKEAFDITELSHDLDEVQEKIRGIHQDVRVVATGASLDRSLITHEVLGKTIRDSRQAYLILFGTGSGLAKEVVALADHCLEPIRGAETYNHLPVRAAVAITLDRLFRGALPRGSFEFGG